MIRRFVLSLVAGATCGTVAGFFTFFGLAAYSLDREIGLLELLLHPALMALVASSGGIAMFSLCFFWREIRAGALSGIPFFRWRVLLMGRNTP